MKNKEIEELLNKAKDISKYGTDGKQHTRMFNQFEAKALLSYIEELEAEIRESNESITWWTNRFNAVEKNKKQLENNRDKAIELLNKLEMQPAYLDCKYYELYGFNEIKDILKGDSDEI